MNKRQKKKYLEKTEKCPICHADICLTRWDCEKMIMTSHMCRNMHVFNKNEKGGYDYDGSYW